MLQVNGIEMCAGSYELPEIVDVTTTPVYQYRNVINEVDVSMAVRSRSPVYMSWFLIGTKSPRQITEGKWLQSIQLSLLQLRIAVASTEMSSMRSRLAW